MRRLAGPGGAALLALLGAVLGLLSASRPWVHALVDDPVLGRTTVTASGRQAAPVVPAVALVALAGGVALLLARTLGRRVAGALLVLAGAAGAAATVSTVRSPSGGVADLVGRALGTVGTRDAQLDVTAWPWLALAGAVCVVLAGCLAVLRARVWAAPRTRFEAPVAGSVEAAEAAPAAADPWDALTRGDDPTR
ncbi:hypothetical protein GCM10027446_29950 [Angustibacter peucedani]